MERFAAWNPLPGFYIIVLYVDVAISVLPPEKIYKSIEVVAHKTYNGRYPRTQQNLGGSVSSGFDPGPAYYRYKGQKKQHPGAN